MQNMTCKTNGREFILEIYHLYNDRLFNFLLQMIPYGNIVITVYWILHELSCLIYFINTKYFYIFMYSSAKKTMTSLSCISIP